MGVAADCAYVSFYGSVQNATANILNSFNVVSSLYKVSIVSAFFFQVVFELLNEEHFF